MYDETNNFEKYPGANPEAKAERFVPPEQDFSSLQDMPERRWDQFGTANETNEYYGESVDDEGEQEEIEYNEGLADASVLINYGLDAVAREIGVEATIQGIKSFDGSGSDNPLRDLYDHLGIDTKKEFEDVRDESLATKHFREQLRSEYNMPKSDKRSREGAIKAVADMKELITEVEGADPRYDELRQAASATGKGYFEYAVQDYGMRGLTELFSTLAAQKKAKSKEEESKEDTKEVSEAKLAEGILADIQPANQPVAGKALTEPGQVIAERQSEQPTSEKSQDEIIEKSMENLTASFESKETSTPEAEGALYQVAPTETNPDSQTSPDLNPDSEKEKDPSYRLGQENKSA